MRLLGDCPNCGSRDTLSAPRIDHNDGPNPEACRELRCSMCRQRWIDPITLCEFLRRDQPNAQLIDVGRDHDRVIVWFLDARTIPAIDLISLVLNTALTIEFGMQRRKVPPQHVRGRFGPERIDLRPSLNPGTFNHFGLISFSRRPGETLGHVLEMYEDLLNYLFEWELWSVHGTLGHGTLVRLDPQHREYQLQVCRLLWLALAQSQNAVFANDVFESLAKKYPNFVGAKLQDGREHVIIDEFLKLPNPVNR